MLAVAGYANIASAQSKDTIRFIVGFGPGGPIDTVARATAEKVAAALKKTVIVENKPGASTLIAAVAAKRARPDGTTFLFDPSTAFTLFAHTKRKLPYDVEKDFIPVSRIAIVPGALAVSNDSPAKTLAEYLSAVKAGQILPMVGVVSLGGAPHIGIVGLGHESGISFTPVPYPGGGGPLVTDLLGGHLPAAADGAFISLHKAGRARVLAVTTDERLPLIPDVPTFRESGMSAYRSFSFGLWAPAGTPAAIIKSIETAIAEMKDDAALGGKLAEMGILLSPQGSDEFANSLREEREALKPMVEASGYQGD